MGKSKTVNRNPRVAVTFAPEAYELLDELSQLLGQPKSSLVSELVSEALPALKATVEAVRIAKQQPKEAERLMADYAARASMKLSEAQVELHDAVDDFEQRRADGAS